MYSDKIRLVKETIYRQALLFLIISAGYVVVAFFTCMKNDTGLQLFVLMFTSFNMISLIVAFLLLLAAIYYLRYKYNMKKRQDFLQNGVKYPGEIINTFTVKNWFGQGRARNYRMVIRYDGDKEFVTPPYDTEMEYRIVTNACNVYVLKGKCYAADFIVKKKR